MCIVLDLCTVPNIIYTHTHICIYIYIYIYIYIFSIVTNRDKWKMCSTSAALVFDFDKYTQSEGPKLKNLKPCYHRRCHSRTEEG